MRVCLITEYFYPDNLGGGGPLLSQLVRSLADTYSDMEIDVITSRNLYRMKHKPLRSREDWNGVRITRLMTPKPNVLPLPLRMLANLHFSTAALITLARRPRYDLLIVATAPITIPFAANMYKRMTQTPYLYIVHDLEPDRAVAMRLASEDNLFVRIMRSFQGRWLREAGKVAVIGRCMRDLLARNYSLSAEHISVIPVGENPDRIQPSAKQSAFRSKNSINGFMVLYGGNFGRYHNFDTILDAAKQIAGINEDVVFVLAGGGAQKAHIAARIEREGISNVRLFGYINNDEYSEVLASSDVALVTLEPGMEGICVPSKFYGILSAGVPAVALVSAASEIGMVVEETNCGVQIDQGDTEKLVNTIARLSYAPDEVAEMGRNGRSVLIEKYSSRELTSAYYQVAQDIIQSNPLTMPEITERLNVS